MSESGGKIISMEKGIKEKVEHAWKQLHGEMRTVCPDPARAMVAWQLGAVLISKVEEIVAALTMPVRVEVKRLDVQVMELRMRLEKIEGKVR